MTRVLALIEFLPARHQPSGEWYRRSSLTHRTNGQFVGDRALTDEHQRRACQNPAIDGVSHAQRVPGRSSPQRFVVLDLVPCAVTADDDAVLRPDSSFFLDQQGLNTALNAM